MTLFRELPYYSCYHIPSVHGQFNNSLSSELQTKKDLDRLPSLHDIDLFSLNVDNSNFSSNCNSSTSATRCRYYSPHSFSQLKKTLKEPKEYYFSLFHNNVRSLKANIENLQTHLLNELDFHFNVIAVTETRISHVDISNFNPSLPNYNFEHTTTPLSAGGVGMYIDDDLQYTVIAKQKLDWKILETVTRLLYYV